MPTIRFTKDARYHEATEIGSNREIVIPAGTVREVNESTAARWERRGVAERMTGTEAPRRGRPPRSGTPEGEQQSQDEQRPNVNDTGSPAGEDEDADVITPSAPPAPPPPPPSFGAPKGK